LRLRKDDGHSRATPDHDHHDIIVLFSRLSRDAYAAEASERGEARLQLCRVLLIANAAHLAPQTIARIERWLTSDRRLIVTGKTNLPLKSCTLEGEENRFVERTLSIRQLPADEAAPIKAALIAAIPEKRGRVT
jgi:hypothetical protein